MDNYLELVEAAKKHRCLYHYASPTATLCIFKNKSLRLSRIDQVNDPDENNRIKSLWNKKVYLLCFTYGQDNSEYFFQNYGKVRLEFAQSELAIDKICSDSELNNPFTHYDDYGRCPQSEHRNYKKASSWCVYDITTADVYYSDNLDSHIAEDGFESNAGLIKAMYGIDIKGKKRNWSIEAETRIRVSMRPIGPKHVLNRDDNKVYYPSPDFEYVYIPLPKLVGLTLCPDIADCEKQRIINAINENGLSEKVIYT